jgi:bla regulator protein BlaR1
MTKRMVSKKIWLLSCAMLSGLAPAQTALGPKAKEIAVTSPILYDVATIKPNTTLSGNMSWGSHADSFTATNASVKILLENAYDIRDELISGLPAWALSAQYDVVAKVSDADLAALKKLSDDEQRAMVRQLLQERFHIKAHIEVKTLPVFDLLVAKEGIKFKPFVPTEGEKGGDMTMNWKDHNLTLTAHGIEMSNLAYSLCGSVGRTVTDKTHLLGKYDVSLKWLSNDAPAGGDDAAPPIFTALQDQLGLKLVSTKGPVETLVIDNISQPTEN